MGLEVRGITAAETERFIATMSTPFAFDIDDDPGMVERFSVLFEPDRARCAFDGADMVGTLGSFSLDMTVPGGHVPCAGTTMVTVLPTHRRRGVLRAMIAAHFEEARLRHEPIAALWASDSGIYHRFGYGMATVLAEAEIDRSHIHLHRLAPTPRPVRLVDAEDALEQIRPVFGRVARSRPGMYARSDGWWDRRLRDRPSDRQGATAFRYAVTEGGSGVDGYVQYRIKPGSWDSHHGDGKVVVRELVAENAGAAVSLWSYLLNHDLVATVSTGMLPEDSELFSMLDGWRRAMPRLVDQMWVRLLDVPAALEARRYSSDGTLDLGVHDPMEDTTTTYRLTVEDGVGTIDRHLGDADVLLDVEDLGAAYLGRAHLRRLSRAGRLSGSAEALALADAMFGWDPAPWCQEVF